MLIIMYYLYCFMHTRILAVVLTDTLTRGAREKGKEILLFVHISQNIFCDVSIGRRIGWTRALNIITHHILCTIRDKRRSSLI